MWPLWNLSNQFLTVFFKVAASKWFTFQKQESNYASKFSFSICLKLAGSLVSTRGQNINTSQIRRKFLMYPLKRICYIYILNFSSDNGANCRRGSVNYKYICKQLKYRISHINVQKMWRNINLEILSFVIICNHFMQANIITTSHRNLYK